MPFVPELIQLIQATGTVGAIVAAILVGLVLCVIVFARSKGLVGEGLTVGQSVEFQKNLLEALRQIRDSEKESRRENAELRDEIGRLAVTVDLLRNQHRRLIDLLRSVMQGQVAPADIRLVDLGEAP